MSRLSYELIQSLVSEKVFQRGEGYFHAGNVSNLTFDGNKYTAKVSGTNLYTVSIWQENNQWLASCNCPYDWEDYCKHTVAVMFSILDSQGKLDKSKSREISSSIKKVKPIEKVIKRLDQKNLQKVLLSLTKVYPEVENHIRILAETHKENLTKKSIADYKKIVRSTIPSFVDYYHTQEALIDTEEAERLALSFIEKKDYSEALKIYQAIFEVLIKKLYNTDDSNGFFSDQIRIAFEDWTNCVLKLKSAQDRKSHFDYIFKKFEDDNWQGFNFAEELLGILVDKTANPKDCQYLLEEIKDIQKELPPKKPTETEGLPSADSLHYSFQKSFFLNTQLKLLDKLGKQSEYFKFAQQNLSDPEVLIKFLNKLIELKKYKEALEIAEQHFDKAPGLYQTDVAKILLCLHQRFKNKNKEKEILFFLFLETREFEYYDLLKKLCQKDKSWKTERDRIIKSLKARGFPTILIKVYFKEKMIDEILKLAKHSEDEYTLEPIAQGLARLQPKESFWVYQKLANNYLAKNTDRRYYQTTCRWLRQMKKLGFDQKFKKFVDGLREIYNKRPAFLDEARNLC